MDHEILTILIKFIYFVKTSSNIMKSQTVTVGFIYLNALPTGGYIKYAKEQN